MEFKNLIIWHEAVELKEIVYSLTHKFLYQARGSLAEAITQVELPKKFAYIDASETVKIDGLCAELSMMINSTIASLMSKLIRS